MKIVRNTKKGVWLGYLVEYDEAGRKKRTLSVNWGAAAIVIASVAALVFAHYNP